MATLTTAQCALFSRSDGRIEMRLPVDGRTRTFVMTAEDAIKIGTGLVGGGADLIKEPVGIPQVDDIKLRPFDDTGQALLRIMLKGHGGEILVSIDARTLLSLSSIAAAALEFSGGKGSA